MSCLLGGAKTVQVYHLFVVFFEEIPSVNVLISRLDEMTQVSSDGSLSWLRWLMNDLGCATLVLYMHTKWYDIILLYYLKF